MPLLYLQYTLLYTRTASIYLQRCDITPYRKLFSLIKDCLSIKTSLPHLKGDVGASHLAVLTWKDETVVGSDLQGRKPGMVINREMWGLKQDEKGRHTMTMSLKSALSQSQLFLSCYCKRIRSFLEGAWLWWASRKHPALAPVQRPLKSKGFSSAIFCV